MTLARITWADGRSEMIDVGHYAAARLIVPVPDKGCRYGFRRVEFDRRIRRAAPDAGAEDLVVELDVDVGPGTEGDRLVVEWLMRLLDREDPGVGSAE